MNASIAFDIGWMNNKCAPLTSVIPNSANAGPHIQLRMLAHGVGIAHGPTVVRGDRIVQALDHGFLLDFDAIQILQARQQSQGGFVARVRLSHRYTIGGET
jgi:hypothetical protein